MGLSMLRMAVLAAILALPVPIKGAATITTTTTTSTANNNNNRQGYQINPKPCWVDGQEGTCMFVYECIKASGQHIGMCVDAFMFGSCCALNGTVAQGTTGEPQPQVLYTSSSHHSHNRRPVTKKPVVVSHFGQLRPTRRPATQPTTTDRDQAMTTTTTWSGKPQTVAASMSVRPNHYHSSRQPTQPPVRHSMRPMSTDAHSMSNSILAPYTKPDKSATGGAAPANQMAGWHYTTEPGFVTKVKKPTSFKPKPYKPTKKPLGGVVKRPTKPVKYGSSTVTEKLIVTTTDIEAGTTTLANRGDAAAESTTLSSLLEDQIQHKTECGVPQLATRSHQTSRIVGGKNAPFGKWPWQVSVRRTSFFGFSSTHRCGGAILNENWIATAGHCVDDLLTSQIRIRVGEYDFSSVQEDLPHTERSVAKKVVHPKYNFFTYEYDLALVQLDKPIDFADHIRPICLPASDDLLIGENATVTGWGRLSEGGTLPSVLQEVQVPIVSNDRCKTMFLKAGRQEIIPDIFLCAGHEGGGQDSCQGDSGGPLQVRGRDGRYFLAGIISWGIGCAEANLPGVCTRISKFVPWILKYVT